MDDLADTLRESFQVTKGANCIYAAHPRFGLYKKKTSYSADQDTRRQRYLEIQKQKRVDYKALARRLALDEWSDDEDEDKEEEKEVEDEIEMEVITHIKPPRRYKDQLMLSEWMVDVPPDFEKNWTMVLCPRGRRNLVVAARGRTCNYSKSGYCMSSFSSSLPGGNKANCSGYTLLDCIYSETERVFYVLDIMCWNQHPVYDCDTEFRFFWLPSKLEELNDKGEKNQQYKFSILPRCPCDKESISKELNRHLASDTDGLLFYHNQSLYTFGSTPLVLWLQPEMLPDMIGVDLPCGYMLKLKHKE